MKKYIKLTKIKYYSLDELIKNPPNADIYVTGSDQVWNSFHNRCIDTVFYLNFVPENKKKISYAASIGKEKLEKDECNLTKKLVKKYDAISVREKTAKDTLISLGRKDCVQVLDPTLLLDIGDWSKLAYKAKCEEKYLLLYSVDYDEDELFALAKKVAIKKRLKIYVLFSYLKKDRLKEMNKYDKVFHFADIGMFLRLFINADFIVAHSFHGTVFSIIFKKQFISVTAKYFNVRIRDLLTTFGLSSRMITDIIGFDEKIVNQNIDYTKVNRKLNYERNNSMRYLKLALRR